MKGLTKRFPALGLMSLGVALWASPTRAQEPAPMAPEPAPVAPPARAPEPLPPAPAMLELERPEPTTVGFGFGTSFPGDLIKPNIASVRIVLTEEVQLEPLVSLTLAGGEGDTVVNLAAGTLVRYVVTSRGPVDLQLLAGPALSHTTGSTSLSITWGAALSWYFLPRFAASIDALNPLFSLQDTTTTSWSFGATWNPTLQLMVHMYL